MIAALLIGTALATDAFDPAVADVVFTGQETWTQSGETQLWSSVELWRDPEPGLFTAESFNDGITWRDTEFSPWIATAFETGTPHSSGFLLHVGLNDSISAGTPILMVPGAGDNASRGFVSVATRMDRTLRPVFALTFAHPHGDTFQQAEIVADAIAAIKARTGASQVDVVAHSKGGIASVIYASHTSGFDWGRPDYEAHGTPYRGDIRRLVLAGVPLNGVDVSFRWSSTNFLALVPDETYGPSSWDRYYPLGTLNLLVFDDLSDSDLMPDGADFFPGQRQLLARQDYPLPGSQPWLDVYALQQDWYTTYEGGLGFVSRSPGIDDAIAAGGGLIARLDSAGVDPEIEVHILAGTHPVMPNADDEVGSIFGGAMNRADWVELIGELNDHGLPLTAADNEIDALNRGDLILGEVTGVSDGLVFLDSATDVSAVDARGAVVQTRLANLSHLDLLYASPITGGLLMDAAAENPDDAWMQEWGERYAAEDTLGWFESVLADPETADPGTNTDTADPLDGPGSANADDFQRPCGGCVHGSTRLNGLVGLLLAALTLRRRRR